MTTYSLLSDLTTIRVGGPPQTLVRVSTETDLIEAVREVDATGAPLLVLGGGSNLLVADEGFPGTVVQVATKGIEVDSASAHNGALVSVAAGEVWDDVVTHACSHGWSGIEALSGIPGSTGATSVQNVSAYGQEVAETVTAVRVWDREEDRIRTLSSADLEFSYRNSLLKESMLGAAATPDTVTPRYVVLTVSFQFQTTGLSRPVAYTDLAVGLGVSLSERVPLAAAREAVLEQRRHRGMVLDESDHDTWSCGSFFTNPILPAGQMASVVARAAERLGPDSPAPPQWPAVDGGSIKTSAAWLIDRAGFPKGYSVAEDRPAGLSTKHTLAVTNRGAARAVDVLELAREVRDGVENTFGVRLVNEPVLVGLTL